jgi:hypothetical protein
MRPEAPAPPPLPASSRAPAAPAPVVVPPPLPVSARGPAGSAPEIIIVGVETHVVPSDAADARLLDAVGRLSRLRSG